MKRTSKLVLTGSAVLGLLVGAVAGITAGKALEHAVETAQSSIVEKAPSDFAIRQVQYADTDHARHAVQFEINMLLQLQRCEPNNTVISGELGFAYTRLAMIEETARRDTQAQIAFDQARLLMRKAHPSKDMTDEQLRTAVRRFDAASNKLRM